MVQKRTISDASDVAIEVHSPENRSVVQTPINHFSKEEEVLNSQQNKKYCCNRFTRNQLILLIVGILVLTGALAAIILIFAVIPMLAQKYVDDSVITISSFTFEKLPTAANAKTLGFQSELAIEHSSPFDAEMDQTTMSMCFNGKCFGDFTFPKMKLQSSQKKFSMKVAQTLTVNDLKALNDFASTLVNQKLVSFTMKAKVDVTSLNIKSSGIDMTKTIQAKGINGLKDPETVIKHLKLTDFKQDQFGREVISLDALAELYNPSDAIMEGLGQLNFTAMYKNQIVGYAYSVKPNVVMPQGVSQHLFHMRVVLEADKRNGQGVGDLLYDTLLSTLRMSLTGEHQKQVTTAPILNEAMKTFNFINYYKREADNSNYAFDPSKYKTAVDVIGLTAILNKTKLPAEKITKLVKFAAGYFAHAR